MLKKILIIILKHKIQKLVYKNCGECPKSLGCDGCDIYYFQRDIKDVIRHLKEGKI